MRLLLGILLTIGGLCGAVMSFISDIVVNSSLAIIDGLELSIGIGVFFIVAFLSGLYIMFLTD